METFEIPVQAGEKILRAMGYDAFTILNPENEEKYLTVARYLGKFEDGATIAQMVSARTPLADKASKVFEYVLLRKELDDVRNKLNELPSEDLVTSEDPELEEVRRKLQTEEVMIKEQIAQYE